MQSYLKQRKQEKQIDHYRSICLLKYAVLVASGLSTCVLLVKLQDNAAFRWLFLVPLLFGVCFFFSGLKNYVIRSMPLSFFIAVLLCRYLVTPVVITLADYFSAMFNGATTSIEQQQAGTALMLYEMLWMFVAIELWIRAAAKRPQAAPTQREPDHTPNTLLVAAIFIGIAALLLFPQLLDRFHFLVVREQKTVANRTALLAILAYFAEFIQVFLLIIAVKYSLRRRAQHRRYSALLLLLLASSNVALIWSANRMNLFLVAGTSLSLLLYHFPERGKLFFIALFTLSITMVLILSSHRLFGSLGATISSGFVDSFMPERAARSLQTYFAGPDAIAGAVKMKAYYGTSITGKTFLNDTFGAVPFVQQLPCIKNDAANATYRMFNQLCCNGYYLGLIIPMVGQGYLYFGALLAPVFSVISVLLLFLSDRLAKQSKDVACQYAVTLLAFNLALFPMYNYTLIMQNVVGRFVPLFLIVWANRALCRPKRPSLNGENDGNIR